MRYASLFAATMIFGAVTLSAHAENATPAASASAPVAATGAATDKPLSDSEKTAIESVIHDYLTKEHPEVLMEAMQELQKRDQVSAQLKSEEAVKGSKDKIFNNATSPVGGNPKGDVTVVEFFDYQCGYCKLSEPEVEKLLKADKNLKFIYKDFPILGPMSVQAAKISLAAARQGTDKYIKLHDLLMAKKDHLSEDLIWQAAKDAGLDIDKLKKDAGDDSIAKEVQANLDLGNDIGVRGTPMFIVDNQVYPGALQYDQLKKAVDDARTANSSATKKN